MNKEKLLPENWFETKLEEISNPVTTSGKKIKTKDALPFGKYPVIDQGISPISGYVNDPSLLVPASIDKPIIIFGDHTRIVKYVTKDFVPGADGTKLIRAKNEIDSKYLKYLIQQADIPDRGYSRHYQFLKSVNLPLAPKNEQRRIADKLDTTLARVDALNDRLARITPLLKRFRQSVLAAATSGRLTEDWRGTSSIESWQAKKLIEVCESISDGDHQAPPQSLEGIPFITISAINNGFLDIKKATRNVPESYYEALDDKRKAKIGDVLFSVTGSISIPALVNDNLKFAFQRHIAILRPKIDLISSKFLYFLLGSESIKKQANSVATGTAQLTIPLKGLRIFHISLPTLEEQTEIVRRVEILFAFADRLEARLQSAQTAAERLTPALLAKAFRGELVPQDPNDEPATELLRRLREARAADTTSKPKRGRAAKAKAVTE